MNNKFVGAICGNGMCPYIPCVEFPKCQHIKDFMKNQKATKNTH